MTQLFTKSTALFLLIYSIPGSSVVAQKKLEGHLIDNSTNQPVSFAHVAIKGKVKIGTASNAEGFFRLESSDVALSDTLLISHINYSSVTFPIREFREQKDSKILLSPNTIALNEIQVTATEDYQAFEDVVIQNKKNQHFPITERLYYRELVKENKGFNKFADGLLTAVFERVDDENKVKVRVDQCRTEKLPKEEDDQFELVSPVKMELVLGLEFGNFLNRFRKENQPNYHFYAIPSKGETGERLIIVEPKQEADRSDDKLLYRALIKVHAGNVIKEVQIEMDSLCHFEKSLLGLKYAIIKSKTLLTFKEINGINHIAFARLNFVLTFTTKKFQQTEDFVSEFIAIDAKAEAESMEKSDVYKKSALYKHEKKYDHPFWTGLNIPVLTQEEENLIAELGNKEKVKEGTK